MIYQRIFLFVFLSNGIFAHVYAQSVPSVTGSRISQQDATAILQHHNKVRSEVGVAPLQWSANLSAYAQRWADQLAASDNCRIRHRRQEEQEGRVLGENIYWGSDADFYKPIDASESWYEEKEHYRYRPFSGSTLYKIGHYTQMIWRQTHYVGVGVSKCVHNAIFVVANYDPAGNFVGEYPY